MWLWPIQLKFKQMELKPQFCNLVLNSNLQIRPFWGMFEIYICITPLANLLLKQCSQRVHKMAQFILGEFPPTFICKRVKLLFLVSFNLLLFAPLCI